MARRKQEQGWLGLFEQFVGDVRIVSKEVKTDDPRGAPLEMWESQRRFMREVAGGLDRGVHTFNCLKSRQLGVTTISLAIDVFWLAMHSNMIGCIVTDTEKNRDANRMLIEHYVKSFPGGYFGESFQLLKSNRQFMHFSNGCRLDLLVAGVKKKPIAWGQGQGYAFCHATEVGNYAEAEGLKSLEEGFAQTNPDRLFVYESTAKGYNHWRTKWYKGLEDDTQHSFFIGWWSGDTNRIERSDVRFAKWGTYPVTYEERELVRAVQRQYGWKISSEQLAWYRWKQHQAHAEQDLHQQNQPFTAEQAFVQTGYSFFQNRVIGQDIKRVVEEANGDCAYIAYEYECGPNFLDHFSMTKLVPGRDAKERIQLKVWEEPHPQGQYAIGCDPAYGRNDHKDGHSLSVWRCYADQMVQVAEFLANDIEVKQFAWVLFHLCAAYNNTMSILELGGPGRLVMAEFDHLKQMLSAEVYRDKVKGTSWEDAAANARWYLYHKADSPGAGYLYNFETTWRTKMELMHGFRGAYMSREMLIRSRRLLDEMLNVQVVDDRIGAPESTSEDLKDDRVFAAAFANRAWQEWIRREMLAQGLTKEVCDRMEADSGSSTPAGKAVNGIVERFLLSQAQRAAIPVDDRPSWLVERGLA